MSVWCLVYLLFQFRSSFICFDPFVRSNDYCVISCLIPFYLFCKIKFWKIKYTSRLVAVSRNVMTSSYIRYMCIDFIMKWNRMRIANGLPSQATERQHMNWYLMRTKRFFFFYERENGKAFDWRNKYIYTSIFYRLSSIVCICVGGFIIMSVKCLNWMPKLNFFFF